MGKPIHLRSKELFDICIFQQFFICSVQRIFGWKLPSKLFHLKEKLCWRLPKVCSENTTEFFLDFYSLEKAALWINKKLMKEIKYWDLNIWEKNDKKNMKKIISIMCKNNDSWPDLKWRPELHIFGAYIKQKIQLWLATEIPFQINVFQKKYIALTWISSLILSG